MAKYWCLLIRAEAALSRGAGRKPGASLCTWQNLSISISQAHTTTPPPAPPNATAATSRAHGCQVNAIEHLEHDFPELPEVPRRRLAGGSFRTSSIRAQFGRDRMSYLQGECLHTTQMARARFVGTQHGSSNCPQQPPHTDGQRRRRRIFNVGRVFDDPPASSPLMTLSSTAPSSRHLAMNLPMLSCTNTRFISALLYATAACSGRGGSGTLERAKLRGE